jgi:hypothetical protein
VFALARLALLSAGCRLPSGPRSLQRHPPGKPRVRRAVRSRLGSALRFSQPLSGFLAHPGFVALFRATAVPGILPSELFPHGDRAPLSRPLASLQLSTGVQLRAGPGRSPLVSPTSTLARGCPVPRTTMDLSFGAPRRTSRAVPGFGSADSLRSASFTCFEALIPPRDRTRYFGLPLRPGRDSPGFLPLRSVPFHTSGSRPARASRARTRTLVRRLGCAT